MKDSDENQIAHQSSIYLQFNSLPMPVRERLLERQQSNGKREGFAFKTAGISSAYFFIAAAIAWIGLVFYLADDFLWSNFQTTIFSVISLAALYLLVHNFYKIVQWLGSRSKCYLLITPHYVIETRFNDLWYWDLGQLIAPNAGHRYQKGNYLSTRISLSLEHGVTKKFDIKGIEQAEQTVEQIYYYKKLFAEATANNDAAYLSSNDDFIELQNQPCQTKNEVPRTTLKQFLTAAVSISLTAGIMFAATSLNNYYDDKKSWDYAKSAVNASSYRTYLQTHPQGRWTDDANQKLQELYAAAEKNYLASLNESYDQQAAAAVLQMLNYAKTTGNYCVKVIFERHNEIPEDIIEQLKTEFEVKNILPLGDTFSDAEMSGREDRLLTVIADAFRHIIADDILEFSNDCTGDCVNFLVKYSVGSKDSIYYDNRQEKLSDKEKTFYPGIFIDWDFNIKIPDQPQNYNFELASNPASEISYDSNSDERDDNTKDFAKVLDTDKNFIYDSMAASAFDDFRANLIYRMGIGTEPEKDDVNEANEETSPAIKQEKRK